MNAWGSSSAVRTVPSPSPSWGPRARKKGTSAPRSAASWWRRASATGRPSASFASSSAAAASELPPPRPAATGICLSMTARQYGSTPASPAISSSARRTSVSSSNPSTTRPAVRSSSDPVGEADPLKHGRHLVLAVRTTRADDQCEVDLRVGEPFAHASSRSSSTNSGGASASARVEGERPSRVRASTARGRSATPASSSEFGQRLAPVREGGLDHALHRSEALGKLAAAEGDERGVDVRLRPEYRPRHGMEARSLGRELHEHRDGAVGLRRRGRRRSGQRPRAGPSRTSSRPTAGRRGSRRRSASRCCTEGSRRACPAADRGSRGRA